MQQFTRIGEILAQTLTDEDVNFFLDYIVHSQDLKGCSGLSVLSVELLDCGTILISFINSLVKVSIETPYNAWLEAKTTQAEYRLDQLG